MPPGIIQKINISANKRRWNGKGRFSRRFARQFKGFLHVACPGAVWGTLPDEQEYLRDRRTDLIMLCPVAGDVSRRLLDYIYLMNYIRAQDIWEIIDKISCK